jgi:hypothetical protein
MSASVALQYLPSDLQDVARQLDRGAQQCLWLVSSLEERAARDYLEHLCLGFALFLGFFMPHGELTSK